MNGIQMYDKIIESEKNRPWTDADQQEAEDNASKAEDQEWINEQRYETEW